MVHHRSRPVRGVALVTALLLSVVLLILGVGYLAFLERDYRLAGVQEKGQQAYYLALGGLSYASRRPDLVPLGGLPVKRFVPAGSFSYFEVQRTASGELRSRGVVASPLVVFAERTLSVPPGEGARYYRDPGL